MDVKVASVKVASVKVALDHSIQVPTREGQETPGWMKKMNYKPRKGLNLPGIFTWLQQLIFTGLHANLNQFCEGVVIIKIVPKAVIDQ